MFLPLAAIISQRLFLFTIGSNATNISQSLYFLYHWVWCNYYLTQAALLFTIDSDPSNKHRDSILFTTETALIIDSVAYVTLHKLYMFAFDSDATVISKSPYCFLILNLMQMLSHRDHSFVYHRCWYQRPYCFFQTMSRMKLLSQSLYFFLQIPLTPKKKNI